MQPWLQGQCMQALLLQLISHDLKRPVDLFAVVQDCSNAADGSPSQAHHCMLQGTFLT